MNRALGRDSINRRVKIIKFSSHNSTKYKTIFNKIINKPKRDGQNYAGYNADRPNGTLLCW